jgi:hypothetical protein
VRGRAARTRRGVRDVGGGPAMLWRVVYSRSERERAARAPPGPGQGEKRSNSEPAHKFAKRGQSRQAFCFKVREGPFAGGVDIGRCRDHTLSHLGDS